MQTRAQCALFPRQHVCHVEIVQMQRGAITGRRLLELGCERGAKLSSGILQAGFDLGCQHLPMYLDDPL